MIGMYESYAKKIMKWLTAFSVLFSECESSGKKLAHINLTQSFILIATVYSGDSTKIGKMAKILDIKPNTMTAAVNVLEKQGFLKRVKSETDKRSSILTPTDEGTEMGTALRDIFIFNLDNIFGDISSEDKDYICGIINNHKTFINLQLAFDYDDRDLLVVFFIRYLFLEFTYYLRKHGLNVTEARILLFAKYSEGNETLSQIGDSLFLRQNTLSICIKDLEKSHLVQRTTSREDSRASNLQITEEGSKLINHILNDVNSFFERIDAKGTADPPSISRSTIYPL